MLENIKEGLEKIQNQITYINLQSDYNKFSDLKDKIKIIKNYLNDSINDLNSVSNKVINGYSIDNNSGDNGFLNKTKNDIKDTYDYLNNIIIPDIENNLKDLLKEMESLDID